MTTALRSMHIGALLPWLVVCALTGCWLTHEGERKVADEVVFDPPRSDAGEPPATAADASNPEAVLPDASAPTTQDAGLPEDERWTAIAVEHGLSCGVRGGELLCWGGGGGAAGLVLRQGDAGPPSVPRRIADGDGWQQVAIGVGHACAIRAGELHCWGENDQGELGLGDEVDRELPTRVGTMNDWHAVAAGVDHSCGLRSGGLHCWGRFFPRRLSNEPGATSLYSGATLLASGATLACIAHTDGIRCAPGDNLVDERTDWDHLAAVYVVLGIRAGMLYGRGSNVHGQLGLGTDVESVDVMTRLDDANDWTAVATRHNRSCGVRGGELLCWGAAESNGGERRAPDVFEPRVVSADRGWQQVSIGQWHACGIREGRAYCWGCNYSGELGDGSVEEDPWPQCQDTPLAVAMPE